ncbi:MAG: hypothetical protein EA374_07025 [Acholeplasmatales bacterium]|nr:MAG: hypothetical protein EA374_07025 [Acholeplasmatales bacterium]
MMKRQDFAGLPALIRLALRRDRTRLIVWFVVFTLMVVAIAAGNGDIDPAERLEMIRNTVTNPGMRIMLGPVNPEMVGNLGAFFLIRMSFLLTIVLALFSTGTVLRHTRHNEETGCHEMLGAMVTGRFAALSAAIIVAMLGNGLLGLGLIIGLLASGVVFTGTLIAGLTYVLLGFIFTGMAAVTAQLSSSTRGAAGLAHIGLAIVFMVNAIGNVSGTVLPDASGYDSAWPVWLSPMGWAQQVAPYDVARIELWLLFIVLFIGLIAAAGILVNRRDVGQGILAARAGKKTAAPWLKGSFGLVYKLERISFLAWFVPLIFIALIFGASSESYGSSMQDIDFFEEIFAASAAFFRFMLLSLGALAVTVFAVGTVLRLRAEENGGPLEAVLATPTHRSRVLLAQVLFAWVAAWLMMMVMALGIGVSAGVDAAGMAELIRAALRQYIGIVLVSGGAVACFGFLPRQATLLSWLVVGVAALTGPFLGPILNLPDVLQSFSPFTHIAIMPGEASHNILVLLILVAGVATGLGFLGFSRRNMAF